MKTLQLLTAIVIISSTLAAGQITVDATRPIPARRRQPTTGTGGAIGRRLPVRLSVQIHDGAFPPESQASEIEFTITNASKTNLTIPVSPSPGDLEPENPIVYHTKVLSLYLTLDKGQAADKHETILPGGAELYGATGFPKTMIVLAPEESVRVLARVALPVIDANQREKGDVLVAHVSLSDETVKTTEGQTSSDRREIGSAISQDYSVALLLKGHQ